MGYQQKASTTIETSCHELMGLACHSWYALLVKVITFMYACSTKQLGTHVMKSRNNQVCIGSMICPVSTHSHNKQAQSLSKIISTLHDSQLLIVLNRSSWGSLASMCQICLDHRVLQVHSPLCCFLQVTDAA